MTERTSFLEGFRLPAGSTLEFVNGGTLGDPNSGVLSHAHKVEWRANYGPRSVPAWPEVRVKHPYLKYLVLGEGENRRWNLQRQRGPIIHLRRSHGQGTFNFSDEFYLSPGRRFIGSAGPLRCPLRPFLLVSAAVLFLGDTVVSFLTGQSFVGTLFTTYSVISNNPLIINLAGGFILGAASGWRGLAVWIGSLCLGFADDARKPAV